jgi:hypothetical protein
MKVFKFLILGLIIISTSCGSSRFVEPLKKNELAVGGNIGGPLINFGGLTIPVPLSAIEVGYGLDTNLTIHGALHTTSILFGNLQIDAGATYKFLNQKKYIPNLSVNPGFNFIYSPSYKVAKFWPTLDLNAYWNYGKRKNYFYTGINNMFELSKTMANDQPQKQRWLFNPQLGHVLKSKSGNFQFTTEIKFLALNQDNTYSFVPYNSITGKNGATGVYLGFRYIFK